MRRLAVLLLVLPACAQILGYEEPGLQGSVGMDSGTSDRPDSGFEPPKDAGFPGGGDGGLPGGRCADLPSFEPVVKYPVVQRPIAAAFGDLNHDNRKDVVVGSDMVSQLTVYNGAPSGHGALSAGNPVTVGSAGGGCPPGVTAVAVGDFDGDSFSDLIYAQASCPTAKILVRRQSSAMPGTFLAEQPIEGVQQGGVSFSVADLNQDGRDDVVVLSMSSVQLLLGRSDVPGQLTSAFTDPISTGSFGKDGAPIIEDLNGDGRLDIAWGAQGLQYKLQSSTLGSFGGVQTLGAGDVSGAAVGDVSGDGLNDAVIVVPPNGQIYVQNGTTHALIPGAQLEIPVGPDALRLLDVNSDGRLDLLSGGRALLQCGVPAAPGTFIPAGGHADLVSILDITPAFFFDIDGNGKVDAFGLDQSSNLMSVAIQN
jgi:hypothetical protein